MKELVVCVCVRAERALRLNNKSVFNPHRMLWARTESLLCAPFGRPFISARQPGLCITFRRFQESSRCISASTLYLRASSVFNICISLSGARIFVRGKQMHTDNKCVSLARRGDTSLSFPLATDDAVTTQCCVCVTFLLGVYTPGFEWATRCRGSALSSERWSLGVVADVLETLCACAFHSRVL